MQPEIKTSPNKKFIDKKRSMSFSDNKTFQLWNSFMPYKHEIQNTVGSVLYSIEVYPPLFFDSFNPDSSFEKWAAVEVTDFNSVPETMETMASPPGLYAVFIHKGPAGDGPKTYQYIFQT